MKKIIERAVALFSIAMLLSCIYSKIVIGDFLIFGYKPFLIMSESMEDTISTYQLVLGKPVKDDSLEVGDIGAYELYSPKASLIKETVIHRVVAKNVDNSYVFKGDNNEKEDPWPIPFDRVKYKIVLY